MISENLLTIGETACLLGVSVPTIRRWCKEGKITEYCRTLGNHRRFSISSVRALLGFTEKRQVVGYARVSSHDQKHDLVRQAERLRQQGCNEVISDLGSGMNCKKRGLIKLLRMIVSGEVGELILTHKDRLLRFGHELIFKLCDWYKVKITILEASKTESFEVELTKDVITLMTVFSARLYGKRSHKNKQKITKS